MLLIFGPFVWFLKHTGYELSVCQFHCQKIPIQSASWQKCDTSVESEAFLDWSVRSDDIQTNGLCIFFIVSDWRGEWLSAIERGQDIVSFISYSAGVAHIDHSCHGNLAALSAADPSLRSTADSVMMLAHPHPLPSLRFLIRQQNKNMNIHRAELH